MKYLALSIGLVSLVLALLPALLVFIFGGICYGCLNLWNES